MKRIFTSIVIQTLLLFTFLFDPSALNIGGDIITIPPITTGLATILGNVTWVFGLICLLAVVVFAWLSLDDQQEKLDEVVSEAVSNAEMPLSLKCIADVLVWTAAVIYGIGLGSGFWFVGSVGLIATMITTKYRRLFWEQMYEAKKGKSKPNDIFDQLEKERDS